MTARHYRQLQIFTVAFGIVALFGLNAYAQGCDLGQRVGGTSTIRKMYAGANGGAFDVEAIGSCGPGLVFIDPTMIRAAGNCKQGAMLAFSGVIRQKGKGAYLHADSARCP